MSSPLYSADMDGTHAEARDGRIDELHAEAKAAVGYAANIVRQIADRYRQVQHEEVVRLQTLTDELRAERRAPGPADETGSPVDSAAVAAETGAEDGRRRALRVDADTLTRTAGQHQTELNRLDVALKSLERTWLFLERDDASLIVDTVAVGNTIELNMRVVEARNQSACAWSGKSTTVRPRRCPPRSSRSTMSAGSLVRTRRRPSASLSCSASACAASWPTCATS